MSQDRPETTRCARCGGAGRLPVAEPECSGGILSVPCERCGGTGQMTRLQQLKQAEGHLIDAVRAGELLPDRTWRTAIEGIQRRIDREIANGQP